MSATRPADNTSEKEGGSKITDDVTKKGGFGGSSKRKADQSGTLDAKDGTKISDPTDKITLALDDTKPENEKTTDTHKGLGESLIESFGDYKIDMSGFSNLLEEQGLSADFQDKAVELVEAVVSDIAKKHIANINEEAVKLFEEQVEQKTQAAVEILESEVDQYLDTVVAEWVQENQLEFQSSVRAQIAESFMDGLSKLLREHNIDLPEEKVDMYEHAIAKGEELTGLYETAIQKGQELLERCQKLEKRMAAKNLAEGLTATDAERLEMLAESLSISDDFEDKLLTLKQTQFRSRVDESSLIDDLDGYLVEDEVQTDKQKPIVENVDPYVAALANRLIK